jgi:phospholipid/cholesterol/gamma-HCH transport system substrate-binding protein
MSERVQILKQGLAEVVDTLDDTLFGEEADGPLAESMRELRNSLTNLSATTNRVNAILARSSGDITTTAQNLRAVSETFKDNSARIDSIINNAYRVSGELAEADIEKMMNEVNDALLKLNSTLASADTAFNDVALVVGRIREGEGSLGKLLYDEDLYQKLTSASTQVDSLIEDFQERPYRYMPFKSRNKVKKYDRRDAAEAARIEESTAGSN